MLSDIATFLDLRMIDDASAFLPGSTAGRAIDMRDPEGRHVSTLYTDPRPAPFFASGLNA